jgi:D-tagatose-1,6-bisphosphate aldolase subunit GatZ/KbaZ
MNKEIRARAAHLDIPVMDLVLGRMREIRQRDGVKRTIFAACPNSLSVIKAALRAAKRWNSPVKFAATLNQVDSDCGYTGMTQEDFVKLIHSEGACINLEVPVIIAIDHGGPWLKDQHVTERWDFENTFNWVKNSFEAAIRAGYDLIHVDPTIDVTLPAGKIIPIELVAERTVKLIKHAEKFRRDNGYRRISYEVGTEEVHGGLADIATFRKFLELLQKGLKAHGLDDVWPCFIVGKVGTDLHTTTFDPEMARELSAIAGEYGSLIKGHYTDGVKNPGDYPLSGMGAANVGPEFTEKEFEGLAELERIEEVLAGKGMIKKKSMMGAILRKAVTDSGRWKKWILPGENPANFESLPNERQEWLTRTGCRYIWHESDVIAARKFLYENLETEGIHAEEIVLLRIESAMDKYFEAFNLRNLNTLL